MLRRNAAWSNPRVLGILILIFALGVAFGSAFTNAYLHARMQPAASGMDAAQRLGLEHLKVVLRLTPEQARTVTEVLDDYGKYYQNIEEQRYDVAEHGRRRILDVLTADQQRKFNELFGPARE
jgi:S-adenosylmethionine hydrolase